jgi:hypothetical protein
VPTLYKNLTEKQRQEAKERGRRWRATNKARERENQRKWRAAHPDYDPRKNRRKLIPREAVIEEYLRTKVEDLGGQAIKFLDPGQRGAPDRLIIIPNHPVVFVELKRPLRHHLLSDAQKRYHRRLRDLGQRVWTLWSKEDVDAFLLEVMLT